ncbi:hypothetical protein BN12_3710001 [Nostocoides japonicum T1-X7]|uniref:Uncharacterized protein n=1 Tax=Nostocoides japonicum T1-X7 TaxID=1194083 RepID=A0A077M1E9_9MICO|nr:hypothetical protein BN12_3710001 [Tetrasphaera japonica T1-X7]
MLVAVEVSRDHRSVTTYLDSDGAVSVEVSRDLRVTTYLDSGGAHRVEVSRDHRSVATYLDSGGAHRGRGIQGPGLSQRHRIPRSEPGRLRSRYPGIFAA